MASSTIPPAGKPLQWAALLAVPLLSWSVGLFFLPHPAGVDLERRSTDRGDLADIVLPSRPSPKTPADVTLDNVVRFLGADIPESASPASRMELKFYFEALGDVDRNWQMFVHIDRREGAYRIHGDHWPTDGKYQTTLWQKGEFVVDNFSKLVPIDAPSGTYDVWLGFYIDDTRMAFTGGDKSLNDGTNRFRAGVLKVK